MCPACTTVAGKSTITKPLYLSVYLRPCAGANSARRSSRPYGAGSCSPGSSCPPRCEIGLKARDLRSNLFALPLCKVRINIWCQCDADSACFRLDFCTQDPIRKFRRVFSGSGTDQDTAGSRILLHGGRYEESLISDKTPLGGKVEGH